MTLDESHPPTSHNRDFLMWLDEPPRGITQFSSLSAGRTYENHWSYSIENHLVRRFWSAL